MSGIFKWLALGFGAGAIAARMRARQLEEQSGLGFAGISDEIPDCVKRWWAREKAKIDRQLSR